MNESKQVLIIGGTNFVGRTIVERLLDDSDLELTLFNRGQTNAHLFPGLKTIVGDRNNVEDIRKLTHQKWDVVIDCSGLMPNSVKQIVEEVQMKKYIFISTISVFDYKQYEAGSIDENFPLLECSAEERIDPDHQFYGIRNAECERDIVKSSVHYTIFRPSIIFGRNDYTQRMYYWYYRLQNQAKFLLPTREEVVSITYMEDLADAVYSTVYQDYKNEIFNISTHDVKLKTLIELLADGKDFESQIIPLSEPVRKQYMLKPWIDIAYFLNGDYLLISNKHLLETTGLAITPLAEAVAATIPYFKSQNNVKPNYGLDPGREAEIIGGILSD